MPESWRPVVGWEERYLVSDGGFIWSLTKKQLLRPYLLPSGYLALKLERFGSRITRRVHQLVLEAFVGPRPDGMEVCHGNACKTDNRLLNLRWDTHAANVRDTVEHGQHKGWNKTHCQQGHEYTAENTYMRGDRAGNRECRACGRAAQRRYYRRSHTVDIAYGDTIPLEGSHA